MTRITHFSALCAVLLTLLVSAPLAFGQSAAPAATRDKTGAAAPADGKAAAQPVDSRINTADVNQRVDAELGIDLQAAIADWQRQLDRVEKELNRPRLLYSELNEFRDQLQHLRSEASELWNKLQPRLQADKAQIDLFGPAPAAGQPAEPEQTALARAELSYHSSLLSGGQTAVNSTNLRIETLLNAIQDVRRKNFSSVMFQPIPGVYAYETWASLPDHVPAAARKIRDLVADWWRELPDRHEAAYTAIE